MNTLLFNHKIKIRVGIRRRHSGHNRGVTLFLLTGHGKYDMLVYLGIVFDSAPAHNLPVSGRSGPDPVFLRTPHTM